MIITNSHLTTLVLWLSYMLFRRLKVCDLKHMAPITSMLALSLLSCQIQFSMYVALWCKKKKIFTASGLLSP
jgi:membrane glycosyltransferase